MNHEFYKTADLCLATVCFYFGFKIENIEKINPKRAYFIFENSPELDKTVKEYFNHELRVDPASFFNLLKEIKTRLYNS